MKLVLKSPVEKAVALAAVEEVEDAAVMAVAMAAAATAVAMAEIVVIAVVLAVAAVDAVDAVDAAVAGEIVAETVTKDQLDLLAKSLERQGLIFLGAVSPNTFEDYQKYQSWLNQGNHGNLVYLAENQHCRKTAEGALSSVQSVIVFALPYAPAEQWPMLEGEPARIASYARFSDYHFLMRDLAEKALSDWKKTNPGKFDWRIAVDTVPILERAFSKKTGTGFIGKNTCFIHEEKGSFLLLGEILTSALFPIEEKLSTASCGSCTLCQVECPTGALSKDYQIDARKCLSYWTIEQRGPIPEEFWPGVSKYWFGCDICQLVCPFNQQGSRTELPAKISNRKFPSLFEVATMDQKKYEEYFGGTALTRAKRNGLRRNALIAMAVSADPQLERALGQASQDPESPVGETIEQIRRYLK